MATPYHSNRFTNPTSKDQPVRRPGAVPADDGDALLYTPAEAARRLRVRESWLRKKAAAGEVPRTLLGKHLRFSEADLAAIVAASARPATGRRRRRKPVPRGGGRDLPPLPQRSVHAHRDDHPSDGSSPWHG
jgi:excisionase family DNA binding protein